MKATAATMAATTGFALEAARAPRFRRMKTTAAMIAATPMMTPKVAPTAAPAFEPELPPFPPTTADALRGGSKTPQ